MYFKNSSSKDISLKVNMTKLTNFGVKTLCIEKVNGMWPKSYLLLFFVLYFVIIFVVIKHVRLTLLNLSQLGKKLLHCTLRVAKNEILWNMI